LLRLPRRSAARALLQHGWEQTHSALEAMARFQRHRFVRRLFWGLAAVLVFAVLAAGGLWWRLSNGPIELDVVTPWLKAAIEENFGGKHTVEVGGTQLERDENGRTSLRLRDIVVRDADGTVVASAPKAEVGLSGIGLLTGHVRAESLNLVGAEMAVRIERDGRITVFAGANKRPIATAAPGIAAVKPTARAGRAPAPLRADFENIAGALAWIDGLGATGLDGHDLRELGLKNGNLIVDDRRNGKHWVFDRINVSLRRPHQGGITFRVASDNPKRPWVLSAAMRPLGNGVRAVGIEARKVSLSDVLLALRLNDDNIEADLPLSASIRADIAADGKPTMLQGQLAAEAGTVGSRSDDSLRFKIDRANIRFDWEPAQHALVVPFQVHSEGNQFTMRATFTAPTDRSGVWQVDVTRSDPVIDPVILGAPDRSAGESFAFNHAYLHARIDSKHKRVDVDQGDFSRSDTRPSQNVGIAATGSLDFSGAEPHLAFGIAGTRMPIWLMKRLWPEFAATDAHEWVDEHVSGGTMERAVVAGNAPLADFKAGGPPTPDEGLSIDMETSGTTLQPVKSLPAIRDADLTVHVTGQTANVSLGRGTVEVAPGRKLSVTEGVFEVPDTHPKPSRAQAHFRIDGSVPAAATLLQNEALREDSAGISLDPTSSRGTVSAKVVVNLLVGHDLPNNSSSYSIAADLTNFAADKMLAGQKVEASLLKVNASDDGYEVKGDVKINGTAGKLDYRKMKAQADGELRLQANLDDAARKRLGINFGGAVTGVIPITVTGNVGADEKDQRLNVQADLTPAKIDNLLPGWVKPAGRRTLASYTLVKAAKSVQLDNLSIDGPGVTVKGTVDLDANNDLVSANFPVFSPAAGDKSSLKADRGSDGVMHVVMRGDVYDGTNFVKSLFGGVTPEKSKHAAKPSDPDLDLDVKIGTVLGYNGETLRGLNLRLGRRSGRMKDFQLSAKIGRDAPLNGDLRVRARDNHQVVYLETDDAGALFRFTDMYPRMVGGQMWVAIDPPSEVPAPQVGTLSIRNFVVRGEPGLERVVAGAPGQAPGGVEFSEMHADFTRVPGRVSVRDGVVRGPVVGVTMEGQIDYAHNSVHLRGTFVPFYGLNNMFGQIPIVGIFLGGGTNEGLVGITYEAVGPPGSPRILVNPVTAITPGLLRKFIPSPGAFDPNFLPASR
jgi:hypothetical protein